MPDRYVLSEADVKILRGLVEAEKSRRPVPVIRSQILEEPFTPETYVAIAPSGGIPPAVSTTVPSTAVCVINRVSTANGQSSPELVTAFPSKRVYNVYPSAINEGEPAVATRDKYGRWLVIPGAGSEGFPGTGTGTGTGEGSSGGGACDLAKLKTSDCVLISTGLTDYYLTWDGSGWTSTEDFNGLGVFRLQWNGDTGLVDLLLGGTKLMNCMNGCYTGGALTGHVEESGEACGGETFTVCVSCTCCPAAGWTREAWYCVSVTGTGTSSCEPLFITEAMKCNDIQICSGPYDTFAEASAVCGAVSDLTCAHPVASTLNWEITNKTGLCSCAPDSGTATYDAGDDAWGTVDFSCLINECEENAIYWIGCVGDVWYYGTDPTDVTSGGTVATSATIDGSGNVEIVFDKAAVGGTYTITFTTPP